jgi:hypothetical protein
MLLIHLSDIHFRFGEVGSAMDPNFHLRNELLLDAERMCERLDAPPTAIMISGDIAYAGDKREYDFALKWLEQLCEKCDTTIASVFVIPGNHDVVRSVASGRVIQALHQAIKAEKDISLDATLRGMLTDPESARLLYESVEPYNLFAGQFFCDILPPERTIAKRDLMLNDGSTLRLSGLNSAFVSSVADKPRDLFVDPAAFQITRERGIEHVVLCHHPYSWLRQGEELQDHLKDVARIHLFGHEHTNRIETARDYVRIAASAAHPDRAERGWEPGYNLIEVEVVGTDTQRRLNVCVHVRVWQSRPGRFIPKMDREDDVFRQEIKLDSWTKPNSVSEPITEANNLKSISHEPNHEESMPELARSDPMSNKLREISIRFFKLTLSQKTAIAGKLDLFEDEDVNQPDFERFRRVFIRARDRGLIDVLDNEITAVSSNQNNPITR